MKAPPLARLLAIVAVALAAVWLMAKLQFSTGPAPVKWPLAVLPEAAPVPGWRSVVEAADPTRPRARTYVRDGAGGPVFLELQAIPRLADHYVRNPTLQLRFLPRAHLPLDAGLNYYASVRGRAVPNRQQSTPTTTTITPHPDGAGWWKTAATTHLSAVVTPRGVISVDPQRIAHSLFLEPLSLHAILAWLAARQELPDPRCLLVHFSVEGEEDAEARLSTAWREWVPAHLPPFPPPLR